MRDFPRCLLFWRLILMRFGLADSFGLSAVVVTVAVKVGDGEFLVGLGLAF